MHESALHEATLIQELEKAIEREETVDQMVLRLGREEDINLEVVNEAYENENVRAIKAKGWYADDGNAEMYYPYVKTSKEAAEEYTENGDWGVSDETWWASLPVSTTDKLQIRHFWMHLHHFGQLILETESFIAQLSVSEPWADDMTFLMQLPGIGLYTGMTILAAIGDIRRFPSAKQLVGYSGLGARVRASGNSYHTGKISKQGRRELRTVLIQSAWVAVRFSDHWREQYNQLANRIGKLKAITAIARKLLVVIWNVLSKRSADKNADAEAVARSLIYWSSEHHLARSQGIPRIEFVKRRLEKLKLLDQVNSFKANGRTHYLQSPS